MGRQSRGEKAVDFFVFWSSEVELRRDIAVSGDDSKYDLRYTQKPIYFPIFTNNICFYLLWPPVMVQKNYKQQGTGKSRGRTDVQLSSVWKKF